MFSSCSALTSIDLSNFNTEKVTRMEYMFSNCRVLRNIIVSENFVISDSVVSENIFFNTDGLNNIFIPTAEVISYNVTYPDKTELRLIGYNDLSDTELTDASLVDATETVTFSGSDSSSDAFSSGGRFRIIPPYSGGGSGEPIEGDSYSSGGGSGEPIEGDRYSSGGGSGDPHIYPIEGDSYELPVKVASYRLLQGDNIFLNVNTRNTTPQESYDIINYYKKNVGNDNIEKLVTEGVFFNDVALMSEGNTLHYSFQSGNGSISTSDYFKLSNPTCSLNKGFENGELMNEIIVSFVHGKYGKISVALRNFRNPQLKYGFGVNVQNKNDMEGLLVREYLCDTMEINNIMNTDVVRGTVGVNRYISLIKNIPGKISTRRVLN
jgi:surface protein